MEGSLCVQALHAQERPSDTVIYQEYIFGLHLWSWHSTPKTLGIFSDEGDKESLRVMRSFIMIIR